MAKDLYFDIGANTGQWTLANLALNGVVNVLCVEPNPSVFAELTRNTQGWKDRVTCLQLAVSSSSSENSRFCQAKISNTLSTLDEAWLTHPTSRFCGEAFLEIQVKTVSLDQLISKYGMPSLLKIDVEGAENLAIKSLSKRVPLLCFEWAAEWFQKTLECIGHLNSLGMTSFHIQENNDTYTYRPSADDFFSVEEITQRLRTKIPKKDWGMIWAK